MSPSGEPKVVRLTAGASFPALEGANYTPLRAARNKKLRALLWKTPTRPPTTRLRVRRRLHGPGACHSDIGRRHSGVGGAHTAPAYTTSYREGVTPASATPTLRSSAPIRVRKSSPRRRTAPHSPRRRPAGSAGIRPPKRAEVRLAVKRHTSTLRLKSQRFRALAHMAGRDARAPGVQFLTGFWALCYARGALVRTPLFSLRPRDALSLAAASPALQAAA